MTEQEYRNHPAVNKSTLWEMRKSPAHYKYALDHPAADTPALKLGRAIHMAILQPDEFNGQYCLEPAVDKRTKDGRAQYQEFLANCGGKEPINPDDYQAILGMYDSVWADPNARELLREVECETPLFWTDESTGIECKCRLDAHRDGVVVDLKSCADASTSQFVKDAIKFGYDVQCAHYLRGYRAVFEKTATFWFICVEKKPPYAVNVIEATDGFVDRGTWHLIDLMDRLKECRDKNEWPGYGVNELVLPEWAAIPDDE